MNELVKFFQDVLHEWGFPIVFEQSLERQLASSKQLLDACRGDIEEAKGLIRCYCEDDWWRTHQPNLSMIVKRLDILRAQLGSPTMTWEEL